MHTFCSTITPDRPTFQTIVSALVQPYRQLVSTICGSSSCCAHEQGFSNLGRHVAEGLADVPYLRATYVRPVYMACYLPLSLYVHTLTTR